MTDENKGYIAACTAYLCWGLAPIYFKSLLHVDALEILTHRIAWCVPTILLLMWFLRAPVAIGVAWKNRKLRWALVASTLLVANNWFIFTWAVNNDRVLDTSLGYFINPILSIFLGVIFLKESLSKLHWLAVIIAAVGVIYQILVVGSIPWLSLSLALTFGLYGLIRKQTPIDALNGLMIETLIALPFALAAMAYFMMSDSGSFLREGFATDGLLAAGGLVTAIPLILFAVGARRLPLNAMGFLQFIAPTITFFLAVLVYQEPFGWDKGVTFGLIWLALIIYISDNIFRLRRTNSSSQKTSVVTVSNK